MAIIGTNYLGIVDVAKRLDPNGDTADVAEMLSQTNEMIQDIPWMEGNLPTGNQSSIRTGLPGTFWRKAYQGVPPSKSTTVQVTDTCGFLNARSEPDVKVVKMANDPNAFRLDEASTFVEAMGQSFCTTLLYGDTSINPEQFYGIAPRFSAISGGASAQNILDGGGTGTDNTSIYMIGWGKSTVFGIYPKNSQAGLKHTDEGEIAAFDSLGNRYPAYGDRFEWDCGLVVRDWRYIVRIPNIDVSDLQGNTAAQANLINLLILAKRRFPTLSGVMPRIYGNRTVLAALDIQALNKSSNALSITEAAGQFTTNFLGIPLRECDQILNTEARVV